MTAATSLLASCLNDILTKKAISPKELNIVHDNAMTPTKTLIAKAVESIVLDDYPHGNGPMDRLGISCMCVLDESDSDCSINSMEDEDDDDMWMMEDFNQPESSLPSSSVTADEAVRKDVGCSRWVPTLPDKSGLVCPIRASSSHKRNTPPSSYHREARKDWAALLDQAASTSAMAMKRHPRVAKTSKESSLELLDQAISFISEDLQKNQSVASPA